VIGQDAVQQLRAGERKRRCRKCLRWERRNEHWGYCNRLEEEDVLRTAVPGPVETHAEFGCVLHESDPDNDDHADKAVKGDG